MAPEEVHAMAKAWSAWQRSAAFPYAGGHCINGTRTAITALGALGVKARPLSVGLLLFNRPASELMAAKVPVSEWPEHAYSIGVDPDDGTIIRDQWNGHLVAEGDGWTLDISSMSFHRPGKINVVRPFVIPVNLPASGFQSFTDPLGQTLSLERRPDNNGWRRAQGWTRIDHEIVAELVRRTRLEMGK